MFVKPKKPKAIIRDPLSRVQLPPEGRRVPDSSYWVRRLNHGDVVLTTAADIAKGKAERLAKTKPDANPEPIKSPEPIKQAKASKGKV